MADLDEQSVFDEGIRQIETTDPVVGGAPNIATGAGMANVPHLQLARRTRWLRDAIDTIAVDATATMRGLLLLATSTEARDGTNATKALTPATAAAAFLRRDLTGSALGSTDNLDTVIVPGVYRWGINTPVNAPASLTQYSQMLVETDGVQPTQMVWGGVDGGMAVRRRNAGVWGAWNRMWGATDTAFDIGGPGMDYKAPGGLIFQDLHGVVGPGGIMNVTNRVAFPNAVIGGIANERNPGGWGASDTTVWAFDFALSTKTQSAARVRSVQSGSVTTPQNSVAGRILVWGY